MVISVIAYRCKGFVLIRWNFLQKVSPFRQNDFHYFANDHKTASVINPAKQSVPVHKINANAKVFKFFPCEQVQKKALMSFLFDLQCL